MKFNENEIKNVVYSAVKKVMNEGLFYRTRPEGKPEKASDVITGNGWTARTVSKENGCLVMRCYKNNDAILGTDDSLPFDELVEDLNIYFEDKGSPLRAEGKEDESGAFITVRKIR